MIRITVSLYSNHLNTTHRKLNHLTFRTLFCLVFKWSDHVIRQTIWIPNILDHKIDMFYPVFWPLFKIWTISQPDKNDIWIPECYSNGKHLNLNTVPLFRCSHHLKTFTKKSGILAIGIWIPTVCELNKHTINGCSQLICNFYFRLLQVLPASVNKCVIVRLSQICTVGIGKTLVLYSNGPNLLVLLLNDLL